MPVEQACQMSPTRIFAPDYDSPQVSERELTFGQWVQRVRELLGDDQTAFAVRLGMKKKSQPAVGRIERGETLPKPEVFVRIRSACIEANLEPYGLLCAWLRAQGLKAFVADMEQKRK